MDLSKDALIRRLREISEQPTSPQRTASERISACEIAIVELAELLFGEGGDDSG